MSIVYSSHFPRVIVRKTLYLCIYMTLQFTRKILLVAFLFGIVGSGAELLLLEHTEDIWQYVPLVLMGVAFVTLVWSIATKTAAARKGFRILMALFVLSGAVGVFLHLKGNVEFELEMYPDLEGLDLYWKSLSGATPALAPGTMTLLGLIGYAYTSLNTTLNNIARSDSGESTEATSE